MGNPPHRNWSTRHYYVDEAGDVTLFDRKGQIIIGSEGCSRFLWSLQRFYERKEDRFLRLLWHAFNLVRDLDETSKHRYGEYYTQKKPLKLAALYREPGI